MGKGTGTATGFAEIGKLPPDELNKLQQMMGAADHKSKENIRGLLLALNRHNLPTTDLKRALERLKQIQSNKQGVDVRQTLNEAIKHMRKRKNRSPEPTNCVRSNSPMGPIKTLTKPIPLAAPCPLDSKIWSARIPKPLPKNPPSRNNNESPPNRKKETIQYYDNIKYDRCWQPG